MQGTTDRVAIVTGGGQGIGGATARRLAQAGVRVLLADFDEEAAQANVARIEQSGGIAAQLKTDVSQATEIEAMVAHAVDLWGRLDILVNNAWRGKERDGNAVTLTESAWEYAMNVMVKSHYLGAKYAVPHLAKAAEQYGSSCSIVNISSVHGLMMAEQSLAYEGAKSAVIGITRQMACDFGPLGIRVNAICPGHIMTEGLKRHWEKNPSFFPFFEQQYPLRKVGTPEDIANAVNFLCSAEAGFITGHTLVVDGGLTIQLQENLSIRLARFYHDHPEMQLPT
ncbi:MAG: SDR family oxidoreductase [Caldilineaceae bacterium]|nr:SDR family oxidoreductase [Caldilineaceae bacterium]